MCRICGQYQETIDHIVAGFPELAQTEYLHRQDKAASYLHWNICEELNINVEEKWYEHEPQTGMQVSFHAWRSIFLYGGP